MNATEAALDRLARVEDPDPALIPIQLEALWRIEQAKKSGGQEAINNALDVAQELGALRLVL